MLVVLDKMISGFAGFGADAGVGELVGVAVGVAFGAVVVGGGAVVGVGDAAGVPQATTLSSIAAVAKDNINFFILSPLNFLVCQSRFRI